MQARRFWPPTKHKLFYANFIVYATILLLVIVFYNDLMWSQKTLRGYVISGETPPSADRLLVRDALICTKKGGDIKRVQQFLEKAVQIEPYSDARVLLGYCYLKQGQYDKMLASYNRYRSINPAYIDIYRDMITVLEKKQNRQAINQLLTEGIQHFRQRVSLYKPHYDPNVLDVFNHKAYTIYKEAKDGLEFLEKMQEQLSKSD